MSRMDVTAHIWMCSCTRTCRDIGVTAAGTPQALCRCCNAESLPVPSCKTCMCVFSCWQEKVLMDSVQTLCCLNRSLSYYLAHFHSSSCYSLCVQTVPKPIATEPCWGSRAGVLTVLLYLPRVPSGIPPPGQSGTTHTNTQHIQHGA